jgi:hypothetical protein
MFDAGGLVELDGQPVLHVADGFNDAAKFEGAHGGAGQQGGKEEVVARADHADVIVFAIQVMQQAEGGEPGAQDDQFVSAGLVQWLAHKE